MKYKIEFTPSPSDVGKQIGMVMANKYKISKAMIRRMKKEPDGILVNGKHENVLYELCEGDKVSLVMTEYVSENIIPQDMDLNIVYEDEYILAVDKPPYMPSHPSHNHYTDTLSNGVIAYLNRDGEEHTIHIITRLDRNTSGIVLFAKSAYIHNLFSKMIIENRITKKYIALCMGEFESRGVIDAPIARKDKSIITRCVDSSGVKAVTEYEAVSHFDGMTLVSLTPHTGRTHQLRVHMSYIGHPIVGDDMYGAAALKEDRHMLRCVSLSFVHPITGKEIIIE